MQVPFMNLWRRLATIFRLTTDKLSVSSNTIGLSSSVSGTATTITLSPITVASQQTLGLFNYSDGNPAHYLALLGIRGISRWGTGSSYDTAWFLNTANSRVEQSSGFALHWWSGVAIGSGSLDLALNRAASKVLGVTDSATAGGTVRSIPLTPTQITANQNNYAPGVAMFYRLSTDASRDVTGLSCSQVDGQMCEIWNVGSFNVVLKHQDTNSTTTNRFICTGAADITLAPDEAAKLTYDSTTGRWRVFKL